MSFTTPEDIFKMVNDYIDMLRVNRESLPERNGKLNATAVATACGIDRGRLYTNPKVKALLDEAVKELGLRGIENRDVLADNEKAALERRVTKLQEQNVELYAEVCALRERLAQYQYIDEMMIAQGKRVV